MENIRIVNVPDVSSGEAFVDLPDIDGHPLEWIGHSGLPAGFLERTVKKPRLSRYRAAWLAVQDAQKADFLISHLPRMTAAIEYLAQLRSKRKPHLAFSFNFTDLPLGGDLARMTKAFAPVEQFCVYSDYETQLYPDIFNIDAARFKKVMWGQTAPITDQSAEIPDEPFVVAIGGEGRDLTGIVAAARARPNVRWVVISRPSPVFDHGPANLTAFFNVPAHLTWGIAQRASAVVVPLLAATTCCGHITIASAQLLGLPTIVTRSYATEEYVADMPGTTVVEPGDPEALALCAADAITNETSMRQFATASVMIASKRYDRRSWGKLIAEFARSVI